MSGDRAPHEATPTRQTRAPQPARAPRGAFGPVFFFCAGALAARLAASVLPPFFSSAFDLAVYAGIALAFALAYRRFVRRAIEDRRRARAQQRGDAPSETPDR